MKATCALYVLALVIGLQPLDALPFEGQITTLLSRQGETQTILYTVGTNQMRIERAETNWPYAKNIVERESGAIILVLPHNRTFVRLKPAVGTGGPPPWGAASVPVPPIVLPPGTGPHPTPLPGRPPVPTPLPPAQPLAPGELPSGTRFLTAQPGGSQPSGVPGPQLSMPAMPPPPTLPREQLELKSTDQTTNLLGYTCTRYELRQRGVEMEIWATDRLLPFQGWLPNQAPRFGPGTIEERWGDLLKAKKLFPLLAILRLEKGPERLRFEIKEVKPMKINDTSGALFKPPADYHEIEPLPF